MPSATAAHAVAAEVHTRVNNAHAVDFGRNWNLLHPPGHPNRYFRTIANDAEQGQMDAYFASHILAHPWRQNRLRRGRQQHLLRQSGRLWR
jgi:hypothetical protein